MPINSPLTSSPMPLLQDSPNIESATHPGFTNLEKYAIPRFSTVGARNAAFSGITPQLHQLVQITSLGPTGLQIWTGSEWVEWGEWSLIRDKTVRSPSMASRSSVTFTDIPGLVVPVTAGTWRIEASVIYSTANTFDTNIGINFVFPGSTSRMSCGVLGRGVNSQGGNAGATTMNTNNQHRRVSGDVDFDVGGNSGGEGGLGNTTFVFLVGCLNVTGSNTSGNLRVQYARRGTPGEVRVHIDSMLQARKF